MSDKQSITNKGSIWFRRLVRECEKISPHIRFVKIKMGFYRIYWRGAYIHEVFKEMPHRGYDWVEKNPYLQSKKYYQEYEDNIEMIRKVKNYKEGYYDAIKRIKIRVHQMNNDKEFYKNARNAYKQMKIK